MKMDDLEFANALTFGQAHDLKKALDAALDAIVFFGSEKEHMETLATLRLVAMVQVSDALKADRERREAAE